MKDIFAEKDSYYSLRNPSHLQLPRVRITIYGIEAALYGPTICNKTTDLFGSPIHEAPNKKKSAK